MGISTNFKYGLYMNLVLNKLSLLLAASLLASCQQEKAEQAAIVDTAVEPAKFAEKYTRTEVDMALKQVSEHAWYAEGAAGAATDNEGFISNAAVVITDEGVVIFDTLGTPSLAQKLLQLIREKTDQPIKYVILSHYHADHIYGLQVFEDEAAQIIAPTGAEIYLNSENATSRLEERRVSLYPWVDESTRLVEPDEYIDTSKEILLGGLKLTLSYLGAAHSDGDISLYVEPDRVLFSGDVIFEGRVPFVGDADTRHWLETLEKMELAELAALVPGHGPAATRPQEAIKSTRNYLAYLREQLAQAVEEFTPFDEAYAAIDWSAFAAMPAFDEAHRRNAYQVYLSLEAEGF